jgi:hypothetical protein
MNRRNLKVIVGHRSSAWPGSRWCQPVGWTPKNKVEGAEWDEEAGAWMDASGEYAGIIILGADRLQDGQGVKVPANRLRVVTENNLVYVEV